MSLAKPNFRSPLVEQLSGGSGGSWGILDIYWQRVIVSMVDAINVQSSEIAELKTKVAALEQYNVNHP